MYGEIHSVFFKARKVTPMQKCYLHQPLRFLQGNIVGNTDPGTVSWTLNRCWNQPTFATSLQFSDFIFTASCGSFLSRCDSFDEPEISGPSGEVSKWKYE